VKFTASGDIVAVGSRIVPSPIAVPIAVPGTVPGSSDVSARPAGSRDPTVLAASCEVRLWVRDTGPGIAAADAQRVFERFGRAETGRGVDGSGLGLSIVAAIADAHGGRVELDSRPGDGARFTIVLPAGTPGVPDAGLDSPVDSPSDTPAMVGDVGDTPVDLSDDDPSAASASPGTDRFAQPARPARSATTHRELI